MPTPEELVDPGEDMRLGPLTTRGDDVALKPRSGTDELQRVDEIRQSEEFYRCDVLTDRNAMGGRSINATRDNGQEAATRIVLHEFGEPIGYRLTNSNMGRIWENLGAEFEDAAARLARRKPRGQTRPP